MKMFCINLNRRLDKQEYVQSEFNRIGLSGVQRLSAINTKPGWIGCAQSHARAMESGIDENIVIVFEDDVKFLIDDTETLFSIIDDLPYDWDMLSFGCSPQSPLKRYSDSLVLLNRPSLCMHSYAIRNNNGLMDYVLDNRDNLGKIDKWFSDNVYINEKYNTFLTFPLYCTQVQFQSDTCKRSDVSTIEKNYNKYIYG